jgi:hypothetical protein
MNIPTWLLNEEQERELDKVNAFYLQKEAEVRTTPGTQTCHI